VLVGGLLYFLKDLPVTSGVLHLLLLSAIGGLTYLGLHWFAKTEEMQFIRHTIIPKTLKLVGKRN